MQGSLVSSSDRLADSGGELSPRELPVDAQRELDHFSAAIRGIFKKPGAELDFDTAHDALVSITEGGNSSLAALAARALAQRGGTEGLDHVRSLMCESDSSQVVSECIEGLARYGTREERVQLRKSPPSLPREAENSPYDLAASVTMVLGRLKQALTQEALFADASERSTLSNIAKDLWPKDAHKVVPQERQLVEKLTLLALTASPDEASVALESLSMNFGSLGVDAVKSIFLCAVESPAAIRRGLFAETAALIRDDYPQSASSERAMELMEDITDIFKLEPNPSSAEAAVLLEKAGNWRRLSRVAALPEPNLSDLRELAASLGAQSVPLIRQIVDQIPAGDPRWKLAAEALVATNSLEGIAACSEYLGSSPEAFRKALSSALKKAATLTPDVASAARACYWQTPDVEGIIKNLRQSLHLFGAEKSAVSFAEELAASRSELGLTVQETYAALRSMQSVGLLPKGEIVGDEDTNRPVPAVRAVFDQFSEDELATFVIKSPVDAQNIGRYLNLNIADGELLPTGRVVFDLLVENYRRTGLGKEELVVNASYMGNLQDIVQIWDAVKARDDRGTMNDLILSAGTAPAFAYGLHVLAEKGQHAAVSEIRRNLNAQALTDTPMGRRAKDCLEAYVAMEGGIDPMLIARFGTARDLWINHRDALP